MPYTFSKQRFCHLAPSGRDRKRGQFWIAPPAPTAVTPESATLVAPAPRPAP